MDKLKAEIDSCHEQIYRLIGDLPLDLLNDKSFKDDIKCLKIATSIIRDWKPKIDKYVAKKMIDEEIDLLLAYYKPCKYWAVECSDVSDETDAIDRLDKTIAIIEDWAAMKKEMI